MKEFEFTRYVVPLRDRMFRYAQSLLLCADEAEDVTHDLLERLWTERGRLDGCRDIASFVMAAVRNRCYDCLRRRRADGRRNNAVAGWAERATTGDAEGWEARDLVRRAMAELPGRQREVLYLKATGNNKNAAKYCGMAEKRNIIMTLAISGMLAGLGAAMLYLTGYEQWQCSTSSVPGMGFNGIAAAFLGGLNPIGAILASFFIQHITAGGAYVDKSMYCAQISDLISSIIIYLCGFVLFMKYAMNTAIAKREEKAALKEKERAQTPEVSDNGKGGDQ